MPDIKRSIFTLGTLLLINQNLSLASEYPAPPGHYGQDKILQNSTFNTGKGSPYINIVPADKNEPNLKQHFEQTQQVSSPEKKEKTEKTGIKEKNSAAPAQVKPQFKPQEKPAQAQNQFWQPTTPLRYSAAESKQQADILPAAADEQPVYSPAPETAPSRFQQQIYPDAEDLSLHYKKSRELSFGQWGEELPETQTPIQPQNQPQNQFQNQQAMQYDYPGVAPANQSFRGSPGLAAEMFNPKPYQPPVYKQPRRNNNSFMNPGDFPMANMMDQFWAGNKGSGLMPPINNQLKTFDQFPVPQNLYGPSPLDQQSANTGNIGNIGNRQYFRQIPKEEIIYPPHYPGNR